MSKPEKIGQDALDRLLAESNDLSDVGLEKEEIDIIMKLAEHRKARYEHAVIR